MATVILEEVFTGPNLGKMTQIFEVEFVGV